MHFGAHPPPTVDRVTPTPLNTVLAVLRNPSALSIELLADVVTTLALIPEVISFSVIAGVDPR